MSSIELRHLFFRLLFTYRLKIVFFFQVHVPPLNHIGLWVDDLEKAVDWMGKAGVRFTPGGIRPGAAGHNITFIHPKGNEKAPISGNGVLIELVQAPPEVIKAFTK
jgi:lactoylglutathione lyase